MLRVTKILVTILIIVLTGNFIFAGIPDGYYDNAGSISGNELKAALHNIISNHTRYPYTSGSTDVWDLLKITDEDPNNSSNVILLYTGRSQVKTENAGENLTYTGDRWNREHVWAKSHGFPDESDTAYTDIHHLRPADESVNSKRNNREFDEGGVQDSEATGCYYDNDAWTWEPRDAVKGDVARMMMYMAVRYDPGYHSDNSTYDLELVDSTGNNATNSPLFGKLSTLLTWHNDDPVDDWERTRNDTIYHFQGNRNPFIDHPEYATSIWGSSTTTVYFASTGATVGEGDGTYALTVSISNVDSENATTAQVAITSGSGSAADVNNYTTQTVTFPAGSVADQTITLTITDDSDYEYSETVVFSLQSVSGGNSAASDYPNTLTLTISDNELPNIFISEYVEGSSSNKYIEIFNHTNATVDLSDYQLLLFSNGSATATTTNSLSGDLPSGSVIVYQNSAATAYSGTATDASAVNFNGNDAIALYCVSTTSYVDIFGVIGDDPGSAWTGDGGYTTVNKTLVRKQSVSAGITTNPSGTGASAFTTLVTEWDVYNQDDVNYLGSHNIDHSLPVELTSFTADNSRAGEITLNWVTESEIENLGFILERGAESEDGTTAEWTEIASYITDEALRGQGSVTYRTVYTYTDKSVELGVPYDYRLADVSYAGEKVYHALNVLGVAVTEIPEEFALFPAYPNPFNPETVIRYQLSADSDVSLQIYDVKGQMIETLLNKTQDPGFYKVNWKPNNLPSGVYFCKLTIGDRASTQKLILLK